MLEEIPTPAPKKRELLRYPDRSKKFPFDATCGQIVRALEERNFQVPGIKVTFRYENGKPSEVDTIEGNDFRLWFCRIQGIVSERKNDIAAVKKLNIPGQELHVYSDDSGPTYYKYVGNNWEKDRDYFMNSPKVNSKLYKEPRTYLLYKGAWIPQGRDKLFRGALIVEQPYERGIAPYLVHDNDLGREYDLGPNDIPYYETKKVMEEFDNWLINNVLAPLQKGGK